MRIQKEASLKGRRFAANTTAHIFLTVMCIIWLLPFVWLAAQSFRLGKGQFTATFFPTAFTLDNYRRLFTDKTVIDFPRTFLNTLFVACCTCVLSTFFVLSVAFCTSRLKWKMRRTYMNLAMVINLFPGFMAMVAVYFLLKALGMTEGDKVYLALIICFSAGAGTGFFVLKGYMDTIPKAFDEAAFLDGATRWQTFTRVTIPLCKPMIVYQVIISFMVPWVDFVFARTIVGAQSRYFTVSIGLFSMLEKEYVYDWFPRFCAGSVLVSLPIAFLFVYTQKFYREAMSGGVKG